MTHDTTDRAAGEGLRPCAHCGFDEPKVHEWYGGCAIYCPNCLVTTTHNGYPDRSHAVKVWQLRRTESPAPQPSAEADAARARGERSRLAEALRRYLGPSDIEWASLTEQRIPTAEGEARMAEQVEVVKRAQDEIP